MLLSIESKDFLCSSSTDASDKKLAPALDLILTSRCSVIAHGLVAAKKTKWIDSKREFKISCVTGFRTRI